MDLVHKTKNISKTTKIAQKTSASDYHISAIFINGFSLTPLLSAHYSCPMQSLQPIPRPKITKHYKHENETTSQPRQITHAANVLILSISTASDRSAAGVNHLISRAHAYGWPADLSQPLTSLTSHPMNLAKDPLEAPVFLERLAQQAKNKWPRPARDQATAGA